MELTPFYLTTTYSQRFAKPDPRMVSRTVDLLDALYKSLSPRWPIQPDQQSVSMSVGQLSDFFVATTLFSGNGTISIKVDRIVAEFKNLRNADDLKIAQDSFELAEEAMLSVCEGLEYGVGEVFANVWLNSDEPDRALGAMSNVMSKALVVDLDGVGAESMEQWPFGHVSGDTEGWTCEYKVQPAGTFATLLVATTTTFAAGSPYSTVGSRADKIDEIHRAILRSAGLVDGENGE